MAWQKITETEAEEEDEEGDYDCDDGRCWWLSTNVLHACLWQVLRNTGLRMSTLTSIGLVFFFLLFLTLGVFVPLVIFQCGFVPVAVLLAVLFTPLSILIACRGHKSFGIGPAPSWPALLQQSDNRHAFTRCVAISDTHSEHWKIDVPEGDVLLHAGDFSIYADECEIVDFNEWLGTLPHKHKIVIAGNHDFPFDKAWRHKPGNAAFWRCGVGKEIQDYEYMRGLLTNCTYIEDEQITVEGINIYGTPAQPPLVGHDWAHCKDGPGLTAAFEKIPQDIDVLITHSPPFGHGDVTLNGKNMGCTYLMEAVKRARPLFHVFGHIHDGYGVTSAGGTTFINPSSCTTLYHPCHQPIVFDVARHQP